MEQVQRRFVKFDKETLDIVEISFSSTSEKLAVFEVAWELVEPFFNLEKSVSQYYPVFNETRITGFRRKEFLDLRVKTLEGDYVKSLRPYENFITQSKIPFIIENDSIFIRYDSSLFDAIDNDDNINRLTLVKDKLYNFYITRHGDPFTIYHSFESKIEPILSNGITFAYSGAQEISVYVVTKDQ